MTMYVYSTGGDPVGFVFETSIYDLDGRPVGRILGSRVHRFDGSYVGEWFKEMVVSRPEGRPRSIPAASLPARRDSPGTSFRRRAIVDYGYQDMFHLLTAPANDGYADYQVAAE